MLAKDMVDAINKEADRANDLKLVLAKSFENVDTPTGGSEVLFFEAFPNHRLAFEKASLTELSFDLSFPWQSSHGPPFGWAGWFPLEDGNKPVTNQAGCRGGIALRC